MGLPTAQAIMEPGRPRGRVPYARGIRMSAAEGLRYPDIGFSGLMSVDLQLTERGDPISGTRVVFRVAPWIMVSNVSHPHRVFMCEMDAGRVEDRLFTRPGKDHRRRLAAPAITPSTPIPSD